MDLDHLAQRISPLSHPTVVQALIHWTQHHATVLYVVMALAVGFFAGRRRSYPASRVRTRGVVPFRTRSRSTFQNDGEALVSRSLATYFGPPSYHLMNHVTIRLPDGTTEVDHILVSRAGVFVIETKHYKGWIFANAMQPKWTQVLFGAKFRFQNPLLQNSRHVRAVQDLLEFLPAGAIKPVVVFKTEIPPGVFDLSGLIRYVREQTLEIMSLNRMQFCVGRLETARLAMSGKTDVEHIHSLERRHGRWPSR